MVRRSLSESEVSSFFLYGSRFLDQQCVTSVFKVILFIMSRKNKAPMSVLFGTMQFAENARKEPAGALVNRLSSHRIVREC